MSEKGHTPHQLSKGLTYVQKVPPFLQKLKQSSGYQSNEDRLQQKFQRHEEEDSDEDEFAGAQVVMGKDGRVLDEEEVKALKEGREIPEKKDASDDEAPAIDEGGKPLFRRKTTSSKETGSKAIIGSKGSKRKHASDQTSNDVSPTNDQADQANAKPSDTSGSGTKSKKKAKKDAKKAGLLSFDHEA
ncbi:hypothetical protein BZG36_00234 [Bifiguratus adelaidae]|uniref:DUF4604 domain-containing protein n=1 Tax=Bifiguratus adelaidae TaxID=1938954 RepID=A0A261Y8G1_9FUNG|nr:hypothetical protein BZG36_00234 [Bifiguratus adelaidae]